MVCFGLSLLYVGLLIIDCYFDLKWKEYSIGLIILGWLIMVLCFLDSMVISGITWGVVTLIEYRSYLNEIKD